MAMASRDDSTDPFEARRSRIFGLAYRMLGSRADAEDIVQEVYLRWHQADRTRIDVIENRCCGWDPGNPVRC